MSEASLNFFYLPMNTDTEKNRKVGVFFCCALKPHCRTQAETDHCKFAAKMKGKEDWNRNRGTKPWSLFSAFQMDSKATRWYLVPRGKIQPNGSILKPHWFQQERVKHLLNDSFENNGCFLRLGQVHYDRNKKRLRGYQGPSSIIYCMGRVGNCLVSYLVSLVPICCLNSSRSSSVCMGRIFFSSSSRLEGLLLSLMAKESFLQTFIAREPRIERRGFWRIELSLGSLCI